MSVRRRVIQWLEKNPGQEFTSKTLAEKLRAPINMVSMALRNNENAICLDTSRTPYLYKAAAK